MSRLDRWFIVLAAFVVLPGTLFACACGCNVFSVGTRWTMPTSPGFSLFLHYNYMNQTANWGNWHGAPAELNQDKEIRTSFYTLGFQVMADRNWGIAAEAPIWNRYVSTISDNGLPLSVNHISWGDIRLTGMYTGLSEDMSTGLQFGFKLPTGTFHQSLMDRDTQIGTGTIDLLLGGYQMGQEDNWGWYGQFLWQHAFSSRDGYKPGDSFDINGGIHYDGLLNDYDIVPMVQLVGSMRGIDSGSAANVENTGYERLYLSPTLEVIPTPHVRLYGDLRIPLLTHVRGYQLVAPALFTITLAYSF